MSDEKNVVISKLFDLYGQLLTEKQKDVIDLYYNEDLSLSEIATEKDITPQGVRDSIKRGEMALLEFENTLHFAEKINEIDKLIAKIENTKLSDDAQVYLLKIKEII